MCYTVFMMGMRREMSGRLQKSANLPLFGGRSGSVEKEKPQIGE